MRPMVKFLGKFDCTANILGKFNRTVSTGIKLKSATHIKHYELSVAKYDKARNFWRVTFFEPQWSLMNMPTLVIKWVTSKKYMVKRIILFSSKDALLPHESNVKILNSNQIRMHLEFSFKFRFIKLKLRTNFSVHWILLALRRSLKI